jgi:hypothetical protein
MVINYNKYLLNFYMGFVEAAIVGVAGGVTSSLLGGGSKSSGGGGGGGTRGYTPSDMGDADAGWSQKYIAENNMNTDLGQRVQPYYQQSLNAADAINYDPYQQAANRAGNIYGEMSGIAGQQVGQYGQQADMSRGQENMLYGAGQQILNTAQDPQNALYGRTQQQLTDQVRAGQAARGLGNSPVGAAEENQAMSNFNIDWQNQQLSRQSQAMQAASGTSNAGLGQGNLVNSNMGGQITAGNNQATLTGQQAQMPLNAQQYIAGMPAQNANANLQNYAGLEAVYGNQMNQAIPYMNAGIGATQYNATNQIANNQGQGRLFGQAAGAVGNALGSAFGSNSSSSGSMPSSWYGSGGGSSWQPTASTSNYGYNSNANYDFGGGGGGYSPDLSFGGTY